MRFNGKVAVVTGAAQGIGFAIAKRFAQEGATTIIADVIFKGAVAAAESLRNDGHKALGKHVDVSNRASVEALFAEIKKELGAADVLVNNAGAASNTPFLELSDAQWNQAIGVILNGTFLCSQAAALLMVEKNKAGSIVNIASQGAHTTRAGRTHYSVAKAAVVQLTRAAAVELAPYNIRVNAISPGGVATGISAWLLEDPVKLERYNQHVPLGRLGEPEEVAAVAAFLASDEASYLTAAEIAVDGGKNALGSSARAARLDSLKVAK